ncbi:MAG: ribonuclease [Oscillospiraceae bacterium]|nr:ribonuclease [Oscillospiraceae bacterium]
MLSSCVYVTFESEEEIPKPELTSYTQSSEEFSGTESTTLSDTETETESETEESISETDEALPDTAYAEISDYPEETNPTESDVEKLSVEKDGSYTTPEDVAEYIHTFGTLPNNFITKSEAKALGWDSSKGNLWDVAPGKSIGGDHFGNYEGLLPTEKGRKYTECDVNYDGGYRGSERVIFSNDGLIFYTDDHYESFTQLY